MRDICMTLIIWNDEEGEVMIDNTIGKLQELSYKGIFNLSSSLAHQTKSIFVINVELFQKVCSLLRKSLIMDQQLIIQMLKIQKSKKEPLLLGKIDESTITFK